MIKGESPTDEPESEQWFFMPTENDVANQPMADRTRWMSCLVRGVIAAVPIIVCGAVFFSQMHENPACALLCVPIALLAAPAFILAN